MGRFHNIKDTKRIGRNIKKLRKEHGWNVEDIAEMTGFSRSTISNVENGSDTDTSHLIEIAKAIGVPPMSIFDIPFEIKPRHKLSAIRNERKKLTFKIKKLLTDYKYFNQGRVVNDVYNALIENFKTKADPIQISVILKRLVAENELKFTKKGRKNLYVIHK